MLRNRMRTVLQRCCADDAAVQLPDGACPGQQKCGRASARTTSVQSAERRANSAESYIWADPSAEISRGGAEPDQYLCRTWTAT